MQLLCPACHSPLAAAAVGETAVTCAGCALEVDLSRLGTVAGKPRFLPERDRAGRVVGEFQVEGRIGAGGMGQVYRARRVAGGEPALRSIDGPLAGPFALREPSAEPAAVKFLAASLAADPELRARFAREVKVLEALAHPAIVRVLASGEDEGVPWFAMTLVEGPSLRARLAQGPLPAAEALAIFTCVFAALGHAHDRGVVHRDLKPANVLLAPDGAMLADFGIARPEAAFATAMTRLTETAAVLGTLPYMSPEQRAGGAIDRRSDLFSVGVMLYEALTGVLPQGAFPPPSRLRAGLPARLDVVVLRLLQPRPDDRFPDAITAGAAFARALAPARWRGGARVALAAGITASIGSLAVAGGWATWLPTDPDPGAQTKTKPFAVPPPATAVRLPAQPQRLGLDVLAPTTQATGATTATNAALKNPPAIPPTISKALSAKAGDPKAPSAKAGDPKAPSAKAGDPKALSAKAGDPKAVSAKAGDPKAPSAKAGDPKAPSAKAGDPKAGDARTTKSKLLVPFDNAGAIKGKRASKTLPQVIPEPAPDEPKSAPARKSLPPPRGKGAI